MTHEVTVVVKADCCDPDRPAPTPQQEEPCIGTGTLTGSINGNVQIEMPCCCPKLYTRTFIIDIGPRDLAALIVFLQTTVGNWEANGYRVLAHSLTDTGAKWLLGLTIAWYM